MTYEVTKTDEQWALELEPQEFAVLRRAGTERPWTGELLDEKREGVYRCRACSNELFRSETKFDSHCGWPSFFSPLAGDRVELISDRSLGMVRTEVRCARCGSHLGHVFDDAPQTPTGDRFCMNSVSLTFEPEARRRDRRDRHSSGVSRGAPRRTPRTGDVQMVDTCEVGARRCR